MASVGLFELVAIVGGTGAMRADDVLGIVDVHDTTQAPQGSLVKITLAQLYRTESTPVTVSTPLPDIAQTWNAGGVAFTAAKINVTSTASAAASLLLDLQLGAVSQWSVTKGGATVQTGSINAQGITSLAGSLVASAAAGVGRTVTGNTLGVARNILFLADTALESGANAGSNIGWSAYDDSGAFLGNYLTGVRSTRQVTFPQAVTSSVSFSATVSNGSLSGLYLNQNGNVRWGIENRATSGLFAVTDGSTDWFTVTKTTGATALAGAVAIAGSASVNGRITAGVAGSATGGQYASIDDGGSFRWAFGLAASVGARDFFIYDNVAPATRLNISATTGLVTVSAGLAVTASGITVTGNSTITGTLSGVTTLTATTVVAALTGNASTATTLQTARTINGVSFNGSANITVTAAAGTLTGATLASNVLASSLTSTGTLANLKVSGSLEVAGTTFFKNPTPGTTFAAWSTSADTTNAVYGQVANNTGALLAGVESSTGGTVIPGVSAYSAFVVGTGATDLFLGGASAVAIRCFGTAAQFYFQPTFVGGAGSFFTTTNSIGNGAGANVGTLTNSPVTGNPTKWIQITDGGVTRYIPAW